MLISEDSVMVCRIFREDGIYLASYFESSFTSLPAVSIVSRQFNTLPFFHKGNCPLIH